MMKANYDHYRKLTNKEKKRRIDNAEQDTSVSPNPQGIHEYHEYGFIDFQVEEKGHMIRLETYRHNVPEGSQPKGIVFIFHGLNSHVGHSAHIAEYFSQSGLISVGFDYRGFGRSEGRGGYIKDLQSHLADCRAFLLKMAPLYENLPRFVMGLSLGGLTAYHLTLENPQFFKGAILMAPAMKNIVGGFLVGTTKFFAGMLPEKTKLTKPVYGKASRNPLITEFVKQDLHAFSERMSLSTIDMLVRAMDETPKTFKDYKCPFMVVQGGLDKLVNPDVAFELYDNSQTAQEDKQILFYENMWHDIWHEPEINEIMERVAVWIHSRIQKIAE